MKTYYLPAKGCNGNRLRLPSPHRDTFRAALTLALRKYWGFGCSLMHPFCRRNEKFFKNKQEKIYTPAKEKTIPTTADTPIQMMG